MIDKALQFSSFNTKLYIYDNSFGSEIRQYEYLKRLSNFTQNIEK